MYNSKIKRFIPNELLNKNTSVKSIEPPKGVISSKAAFNLEYRILVQINANNANTVRQNMQIMKRGY